MCRDGANDDACAGMAQTTGPDDEMCRDGAGTIDGRRLSKSIVLGPERGELCLRKGKVKCAVMAQSKSMCRDGAETIGRSLRKSIVLGPERCAVMVQTPRRSVP